MSSLRQLFKAHLYQQAALQVRPSDEDYDQLQNTIAVDALEDGVCDVPSNECITNVESELACTLKELAAYVKENQVFIMPLIAQPKVGMQMHVVLTSIFQTQNAIGGSWSNAVDAFETLVKSCVSGTETLLPRKYDEVVIFLDKAGKQNSKTGNS